MTFYTEYRNSLKIQFHRTSTPSQHVESRAAKGSKAERSDLQKTLVLVLFSLSEPSLLSLQPSFVYGMENYKKL